MVDSLFVSGDFAMDPRPARTCRGDRAAIPANALAPATNSRLLIGPVSPRVFSQRLIVDPINVDCTWICRRSRVSKEGRARPFPPTELNRRGHAYRLKRSPIIKTIEVSRLIAIDADTKLNSGLGEGRSNGAIRQVKEFQSTFAARLYDCDAARRFFKYREPNMGTVFDGR